MEKLTKDLNRNYFGEWYALCQNMETLKDLQVAADFCKENCERISRDQAFFTFPQPELKYMYTFTIDPKLIDASTIEVQDTIEKYIVNMISRIDNVTRSYYVKEHPDSNVHWHFIIHSKGFVKQDHLKTYRRKYGRVDCSKSVSKTDEFSVKYMKKEGVIKLCKGKLPTVESVECKLIKK